MFSIPVCRKRVRRAPASVPGKGKINSLVNGVNHKKGGYSVQTPARGNALNFELVAYKDTKVNGMVNTVDHKKRGCS